MTPRPTAIKRQLNARLHSEKRWHEYLVHRESIKKTLIDAGLGINMAWQVASFRFQPLNGDEHEVPLTGELQTILDSIEGGTIDLAAPVDPASPALPASPDAAFDDSYFIDGDPDAPAAPPAPPATEPPPTDDKLTPPPLPMNGKWVKYEQGLGEGAKKVVAEKLTKEQAFDRLFEQVDRKKRCRPHDMISWVFEYMDVPPQMITPEEVPSRGALGYLKRCQTRSTVGDDFFKGMFPKIVPDKKELAHEAKQRDDGRKQFRMLDAFDAEFAGKEAEDATA